MIFLVIYINLGIFAQDIVLRNDGGREEYLSCVNGCAGDEV